MAQYTVAVARFCNRGWERCEIGNFLLQICNAQNTSLKSIIKDILYYPMAMSPTSVARNNAVKIAQGKADFLFMVDEDASPAPGFFEAALQFLIDNPPCAIASPAVSNNDGLEKVQVFHYTAKNNDQGRYFQLEQMSRELAARQQGITKVDNVGCHCIGYNLKVFDLIPVPHYEWRLSKDGCTVLESEDLAFHRKMWEQQLPVYIAWDYWAGHWKEKCLSAPLLITGGEVAEVFLQQAKADVLNDALKEDNQELLGKLIINHKRKQNGNS